MDIYKMLGPQRLSDAVFKQLYDLIISNQLVGGERLPSERDLAQRLGVGRSSIREGIRTLASLGLVRVQHGVGVVVATGIIAPRSGLVWLPWLIKHQDEVLDLIEARELIEPETVRLACRRMTADRRKQLSGIHDRLLGLLDKGEYDAAVLLDREFHCLLVEMSGNQFLINLVSSMHQIINDKVFGLFQLSWIPEAWGADHGAICEAVVAGRENEAVSAMRRHLASLRESVNAAVAEAKNAAPDTSEAGHADTSRRAEGEHAQSIPQ